MAAYLMRLSLVPACMVLARSAEQVPQPAVFRHPVPEDTADRQGAAARGLVANPDGLSFGLPDKWECDTEHVNWGVWDTPHKAWCCQHKGKACPTGAVVYDCQDDSQDTSSWPIEKQTWCCQVRGVACSAETYDCEDGYDDFWKGYSLKKMTYCCKHSDYPCPSAVMDQLPTSTQTTTFTPTTRTRTETTRTTTSQTTTGTETSVTTTSTGTSSTSTTTETFTITSSTTSLTSSTATTTSATTTTTLEPDVVTMECAEMNVNYFPLDMPGQALHQVASVSACQELCAQTEHCAHFSFWQPMQHCHLADNTSSRMAGEVFFISGPPSCTAALESTDLASVTMKFGRDGGHFVTYISRSPVVATALFAFGVAWLLAAAVRTLRCRVASTRNLHVSGDLEDQEVEEVRWPQVSYAISSIQSWRSPGSDGYSNILI